MRAKFKMFNTKLRHSIRFRFLSIIAGILIAGTAVLSAIIAINEMEMLKTFLMTKGQSFASYIAKLGQDPLIMKDGIQLDSIVNEANKDEDIIYAVIRDAKGTFLTSQYASINYRSQRLKTVLSDISKDSEIQDIIAAVKKREAIAEISVPIITGADVIGKVTIGMSKHKLRRQILTTVLFVVALNLAIAFALGTVLFISSKKLILDPVVELAQATTRLARGDLSTHVKTSASGEMQMLVHSFNLMAEDLGKRTRELIEAQEELVRKEKLSILGQLSGSVGHELRNPLGVMNNAIFFLKTVMSGADETVKEYLDIIKHEIDNSERIISDLLDFARTKTPQSTSISVDDLINRSIGKCTIPENVTVERHVPDTLCPLNVDPFQTGQVFQNLITNAVQAMPEGGTLRISARSVQKSESAEAQKQETSALPNFSTSALDGDVIEISVTDTGGGISPENMKKLFQPLFTTKARGIGLGLVVCKRLVEANGGKLDVASEEGKGTTFVAALPAGGGETWKES